MTEIGRPPGSGKEAEVFEYGVLALELYRHPASKASAFREEANLAIVERLSLPAPKVHAVSAFDGRWGVVMERAPGACFAERPVSTAETLSWARWRSCIAASTTSRARGCRPSRRVSRPGSGGRRDWMPRLESGCCRLSIPFPMAIGSAMAIFTRGIFTDRGRAPWSSTGWMPARATLWRMSAEATCCCTILCPFGRWIMSKPMPPPQGRRSAPFWRGFRRWPPLAWRKEWRMRMRSCCGWRNSGILLRTTRGALKFKRQPQSDLSHLAGTTSASPLRTI